MTAQAYKSVRESIGTQKKVSSLLGVHRVTLARRETGALPVTREAALAMRSLLGRFAGTPALRSSR